MNMKNCIRVLRYAPELMKELRELRRQAALSSHVFPISRYRLYPFEKKQQSGTAKGHYFHQDLLVARRIFQDNPEKHVDVGSRVDGFVAHVASFREIEVIDIRRMDSVITNIRFMQADLMKLDPDMMEYCDSLSCLHAIEHFGLGRYGDRIDFEGHIKGIESLRAMLKKGGILYLSCPIGSQRIEFNAHRVFSVEYLLSLFKGKFELRSFSYVDDAGDLHENVEMTQELSASSFDCDYGCGIFELMRI